MHNFTINNNKIAFTDVDQFLNNMICTNTS